MDKSELKQVVSEAVEQTPILDVHTHLYSAAFGDLLLWGIDELLDYHYLICETLINNPTPPDEFYAMPTAQQAELVWDTLFVHNTPVSEATRGVVTTLRKLGFSPGETGLDEVRDYFASTTVEDYIDLVFEKANLESVVMTNDVFDEEEQAVWAGLDGRDPRFLAAMRIDGLLNDWGNAVPKLTAAGYEVNAELDDSARSEVRRFLGDHADRMQPVYMAASLPPTFAYPEESPRGTLIEDCILPFSRERAVPFAMMIGVKKLINPPLQLAGDGLGKADIGALERLCRRHPENKFLVTYLSRENQHEFAVTARKFRNLMVFGCWWFLNIPSVIAEMTAERVELLGSRFVPQHSDARVLDQLVYKWTHSRTVIADVLAAKYADLMDAGWALHESDIERDVRRLFSENFKAFVGLDD
ncbi:MAG: glucuronate isomerase [Planctomycetota bacterium]